MSYPVDRAGQRSLTITLLVFGIGVVAVLLSFIFYDPNKPRIDPIPSEHAMSAVGQPENLQYPKK
jgi:hypothetical protein